MVADKNPQAELEAARKAKEVADARLAEANAKAPVSHAEFDKEVEKLREELAPILTEWARMERGARRTAYVLEKVTKTDQKLLKAAIDAGTEFDKKNPEKKP